MSPSVLSLFAGAGGCALGFERSGFDVQLGVDIDEDALQTYRDNVGGETLCRDLSEVDPARLSRQLGVVPGELDFLIGGPPCQGFSSAGRQFWDDPRNELLRQYIRILEHLQPKWFLMENVEGLLTAQESQYITEASRRFVEAGYSVRIHKLYSHWYGLPQRRKRVFVVGNSGGVGFQLPPPTHHGISAVGSPRTVDDALSDLPLPAAEPSEIAEYATRPENDYQRSLRTDSFTDHYSTDVSDVHERRIAELDPGESMQDLPDELQHDSFDRRSNRRVSDGTPTEERGGAPNGLRRLRADEPSLTITGSSGSEFVHPTADRFLTLRECARLQSFPDEFEFAGSKTSRQRQIGNAVPPLIAKKLSAHLRGVFEQHETAPYGNTDGRVLGFYLTKADAMSPALDRTREKLSKLRTRTQLSA